MDSRAASDNLNSLTYSYQATSPYSSTDEGRIYEEASSFRDVPNSFGQNKFPVIYPSALSFSVIYHQLSRHQHGLRPGRSCSTQLLEVLEDWCQIVEQGNPVNVLYLDLSKAFDALPHKRLLKS